MRARSRLSPARPRSRPDPSPTWSNRVSPAVVSVKVKIVDTSDDADQSSMPSIPKGDPLERFFKRFGENGMPQNHPHTGQAQGSGFIISSDGYIVTNNHVVENATDVQVTLQDGKTMPATVVGTDKKTDLALLKLKSGSNYPYVQWGEKTPRVGDWVIAVGNPFGLGWNRDRRHRFGARARHQFRSLRRLPADRRAGEPRQFGRPDLNTQGEVVGVNTAIFSPRAAVSASALPFRPKWPRR